MEKDYSSGLLKDDEPGPVQVLKVAERLSHYDESGQAHMVDVSGKAETRREAVAQAFVELSDAVMGPACGARALHARRVRSRYAS